MHPDYQLKIATLNYLANLDSEEAKKKFIKASNACAAQIHSDLKKSGKEITPEDSQKVFTIILENQFSNIFINVDTKQKLKQSLENLNIRTDNNPYMVITGLLGDEEENKPIIHITDEKVDPAYYQAMSAIAELEAKAKQLKDKKHTKAAQDAETIADTLSNATNVYIQNPDSTALTSAIETANQTFKQSELPKHRGLKQIFCNILEIFTIFTPGIGICFLIADINRFSRTGNFFAHQKTSSEIKTEKALKAVRQLS